MEERLLGDSTVLLLLTALAISPHVLAKTTLVPVFPWSASISGGRTWKAEAACLLQATVLWQAQVQASQLSTSNAL